MSANESFPLYFLYITVELADAECVKNVRNIASRYLTEDGIIPLGYATLAFEIV